MRIWDIAPEKLCRQHLLGEHRELHALWNVITQHRTGYAQHPETLRWHGKLRALFNRHRDLVDEMHQRGYQHNSPLDPELATGSPVQDEFVDTPAEQIILLRAKGCDCSV